MQANTLLKIVGCLAIVSAVLNLAAAGYDKPLQFRPDGTFTIVQFTDLHYGEADWKDYLSQKVQSTVLEAEEPDLVVMTGDSVSGYAWNGEPGWFAPHWAKLTDPMMKLGYRWAFACGNHDDQADLNRTQIVALDQTYNLSMTQAGPSSLHGVTNYNIPVYSSQSLQNPIANLWMFDSGDNNCLGVPGWDCVYPDQIEWYQQTAAELTKKWGKLPPALAFFHIPIPEFMDVWNYMPTNGSLEDVGVCCFSVNTGLFSMMKTVGDIQGVYCGHDHDNDYTGQYYGVQLSYGRKTGYGGYGPPLGWKRGARVIRLTESPFTITTWIRQQDGSVVMEQPLHEPGTNQTFQCCDMQGVNATASKCEQYEKDFKAGLINNNRPAFLQ